MYWYIDVLACVIWKSHIVALESERAGGGVDAIRWSSGYGWLFQNINDSRASPMETLIFISHSLRI